MNLHSRLAAREDVGRPIRVGLIGAGRFGTMYLSQARNIPGIHVAAIADINLKRAKGAFAREGWPVDERTDFVDHALFDRDREIVSRATVLIRPDTEAVVEDTQSVVAGTL